MGIDHLATTGREAALPVHVHIAQPYPTVGSAFDPIGAFGHLGPETLNNVRVHDPSWLGRFLSVMTQLRVFLQICSRKVQIRWVSSVTHFAPCANAKSFQKNWLTAGSLCRSRPFSKEKSSPLLPKGGGRTRTTGWAGPLVLIQGRPMPILS